MKSSEIESDISTPWHKLGVVWLPKAFTEKGLIGQIRLPESGS